MSRPKPATRIVRWVIAALFAIGTVCWATGHDDHRMMTMDLHADAPYYYVYLPSLVLDGDLDFTNQYKETNNWYRLGPTATGKPGNVFGIGPAVFTMPAFLLGHAIAIATGARRDGFSGWEIRLFTLSSLVWTLAAIAVAYRLVERRFGGGALAIIGPVVAALAGPIAYYAVRQPGYAHPFATFWIALLVERWDASCDAVAPRSLRTWLVLGAVFGAAMLARPQLALWGVVLAHAAIDDVRRRAELPAWRTRLPMRWLAGAALAIVVFAPQLVAWKVLYGHFYVVPQGPGFMRWDAPAWSETLFSSRNGLFVWAPALALFAIALCAPVRRVPRLVIGLVAGVALQTVANGAAWDWWAGGSFGGRRFDSAYIAFAVGAGALVAWIASVLPPALRRDATARARATGLGAAVLAALAIALTIANVQLAASFTATSARIDGGESAAGVIARRAGGAAAIAALASSLVNLPVRAWFAWRHDTSLDVYDRVVGIHVLGETYPGLNSYADRRAATLAVADPRSPLVAGLVRGPDKGSAVIANGRARILVVLNRTGRLDVTIPVDGTGTASASWNGTNVVDTQALAPGAKLHFATTDLERGANELVILAPAGTVIHAIQLAASPI